MTLATASPMPLPRSSIGMTPFPLKGLFGWRKPAQGLRAWPFGDAV